MDRLLCLEILLIEAIEETLLVAGIVRAPLKDYFDTRTETLSDRLGFIISSIGKGDLRVPERRFAIHRRQSALLTQLLHQEPRESSRTLARPSLHRALHRRIGHHGLGLGVAVSPRSHEIECRLVGFARSPEDDRSKGTQACRHGLHQNVETLRGRTVKLYQDNMTVVGALRKMSSKCPELMTEIKGLVP